MEKNIKLALITIGNGDWKDVIKNLWESLDINEEGYKLDRCYEEYFYKLEMKDNDLPSDLTNIPMNIVHLKDNYKLTLFISTPVISDCSYNADMVILPWYEEEILYHIASKICSEMIIRSKYCDNVIILCGYKLTEEEREFAREIERLCVDNNKTFWEIGNDCKCMNIDAITSWINSGENYCCYFPSDIERTAR